ncbi:hypothetical protein [Limosilactobacillus vaginalis]|nr:hypothetical protein [Limosilactobacillus vaginalis]
MNNINWDRILEKHDEYNSDYRRRFMDEDDDEMTEQEKADWKADEEED